MQIANCEVKLATESGTNNTVYKQGVTPAEIAVLLAIHGEGSVINIQPTSMDKRPHVEERARLALIYGEKVVGAVFPGQFAKLPVGLDELRLGAADDQEAAEASEAEDLENPPADNAVKNQPAGEDEDDKILRERIGTAKTKAELHDIAKENDVDLKGVEEKMEPMRAAILAHVFQVAA